MTDQDRVNVAPLGLSLCFDKLSYNAYILFENLLTASSVWGKFRCGIVMFCCGYLAATGFEDTVLYTGWDRLSTY